MTYPDAVEALRARGRFGISLGLERTAAILAELGNPQRALRGALIGGTNGKGSVVALAGAVLRRAGIRVGTMPKPHLVAYRERISVDGQPISEAAFAAAIIGALPAVDMVAARLGPPTEFEVLTSAAFAELAARGVDLALVEVGLGGRLDATNVLDPGVAAIVTVQHDHERHLGRTLRAIGAEKAAIIKPGNQVLTGASGRGLAPIEDRCRELGLRLRQAGRGQAYRCEVRHAGWDGLVVDAHTPGGAMRDLRVGLLGSHQAHNAAVALALLDALGDAAREDGRVVSPDEAALRAGFASARWPGRLELLRDTPHGPVLLDGAHNPAGARALAAALAELGMRRFALVFGAMRGKRVTAVLRALGPLEPLPVFTAVADPGALEPERLAATWQRLTGSPALVAADPATALALAAERRTTADQPVVVAGSLYLVGAVRGMLRA